MTKRLKPFALVALGVIAVAMGVDLTLLALAMTTAAVGGDTATGAADESKTPESTPAAAAAVSLLGDDAPAGTESKGDAQAAPNGEQKPDTEADKAGKVDGSDKKQNAPEKYDWTAPEGVTFDSEVLGEFEGAARELDLTQESASKLAGLGAKLLQKQEQAQVKAVEALSAQWAADAQKDAEIGGDKFDASIATSRKVLAKFGTPAFKALLKSSPYGNHPEFVRFMVKVGQAVSDDTLVVGSGGSDPKVARTAAEVLYPTKT
jgi:hypothetical protein